MVAASFPVTRLDSKNRSGRRFRVNDFQKETHRIRLSLNLVVLGGCRLVDHDATKRMLILTLQCLDYFVSLIWLEVHFQVIDDVVIWRCRKTKVDFGVRVV